MFEPYSYVLNESKPENDPKYYNYNDLRRNVDSHLEKFKKEYER
jgi:hypothetical protein